METASTLEELIQQSRALFRERFGRSATYTVAAPGRVNLIGEHTDYNDGFVTPIAIERYVVFAADRADNRPDSARIYSQLTGTMVEVPLPSTRSLGPDEYPRLPEGVPKWASYPWGVLGLFAQRGIATGPFDSVCLSTVPQGSGLSSSAALEVATATLAEAISGETLPGFEKATLCQRAENVYAGVPCGVMDQFSSAFCRAGEAMRLDCRSLEIHPVPLSDPNVAVLVINSQVHHELSTSEYPIRRQQCEAAASAMGVAKLRDATPAMLTAVETQLGSVLVRRARHVIEENARTLAFAEAAERGDWTEAGRFMNASHASLRDLYEVSCPEIDTLVELAQRLGPESGVYGSRITGGGFGGCTVTLTDARRAAEIAAKVLAGYFERYGGHATAFVTQPVTGAQIVKG